MFAVVVGVCVLLCGPLHFSGMIIWLYCSVFVPWLLTEKLSDAMQLYLKVSMFGWISVQCIQTQIVELGKAHILSIKCWSLCCCLCESYVVYDFTIYRVKEDDTYGTQFPTSLPQPCTSISNKYFCVPKTKCRCQHWVSTGKSRVCLSLLAVRHNDDDGCVGWIYSWWLAQIFDFYDTITHCNINPNFRQNFIYRKACIWHLKLENVAKILLRPVMASFAHCIRKNTGPSL